MEDVWIHILTAVACAVTFILWISQCIKNRALRIRLEEETRRCKEANDLMLKAQTDLEIETELRQECENELNQSTICISELQNLISSHTQANTRLNAENEELQAQNTALAEDLEKVKFIASKMKKYIYQCRNKIDFLSTQELSRDKNSRNVAFWSRSLGRIEFDYVDLTNYITEKMSVMGGDVPADEKFKRLQKAFEENMVIEQCDISAMAKVKGASGEIYKTTFYNCTCDDFVRGRYKTPCKHMYRLAIEMGMLTIYDKSLRENLVCGFQQIREQRTDLAKKEKNLNARENRLKKKQDEQKAKGSGKKS